MVNGSSKRILLVEDQVLIAAAAKIELEKYGYEVITAFNGQKGVEAAVKNNGIDLILMDIDLGKGMDGTEAARQILKEREYPIVFLSNHTEPEIVQKTEEITSYGYVVKNSGITVLDASIKMAFRLYQAKLDLREREKRYESLFTNSRSVLLLVDPESGLIRDANPSACKFYGYSKEELVKMQIQNINQSSPDEVRNEMRKASNKQKKHFEFQHRLASGEIRDVEVYTSPIDIGDEKLVYSIIHDITERKKTEAELHYLLDILKRTEKMTKTGGWEFNTRTLEGTWTEQVALIHETDPAEPVNATKGLSFYINESRELITAAVDNCINNAEGYDLELEIKTAKGNKKWVHTIGEPVMKDGVVVKLVGSFQDITERKQAELALAESEESIAMTLQSIGDAVIATDKDGKITRMNHTAERLTGWRFVEVENKPLAEIFKIINSKTRQLVEDPVKKVLQKGEIVGLANHTLLLARDGTEYQIADSGAPIRDASGNIKGVVLVFRDVTAAYEMQEKLRQEQEKLQKAQEMAQLGYWHWDSKTGNVGWSAETCKMLKLDQKAFQSQINSLLKLSNQQPDSREIQNLIERTLINHEQGEFEYQFTRDDGQTGDYHIRFRGRYSEKGILETIEGTAVNITDYKQIEQTLKENESYIKAVLDHLPIGIAVNTDDIPVTFSYTNDNFSRFYRTTPEAVADPDTFWEAAYQDPSFREEIKERVLRDVRSGDPAAMRWEDIPITRKGEETTYITAMNIPIPHKNLMISAVWDVTSRKKLEEQLRSSKNFTEALLSSLPELIYIYDILEKKNLYSNTEIFNVLGYSTKEIQEMGEGLIQDLMHPDDFETYVNSIIPRYQSLSDHEILEHDYRLKHKNGQWRWLHSKESIFLRTPLGSAKQIFGVVTDITDRKKKDEEISRLLQEKEMLLKEVHHRIKNNMNIISSLLSLQSDSLDIPAAVPAFQDAISRINSMQVLYDKLYITESYRDTSVRRYLTQLAEEIKEMLSGDIPIRIESRIDDFTLDAKSIFSLGIIINELLTNAMKHAFSGRKSGLINISATKKQNHIRLVVEDNGVGMLETEEGPQRKGFGLNLIELITGQLDGTFSVEIKNRTRFVLEFDTLPDSSS